MCPSHRHRGEHVDRKAVLLLLKRSSVPVAAAAAMPEGEEGLVFNKFEELEKGI